jgi:hypothetical protein
VDEFVVFVNTGIVLDTSYPVVQQCHIRRDSGYISSAVGKKLLLSNSRTLGINCSSFLVVVQDSFVESMTVKL